MSKKKVRFMCTAFRDGFQSVYGARVFTPDFLPAIAAARDAGINYFEAGGGARFQSLYFYCNEDAFAMTDAFREVAGPDADLQTLSRGVNVVGLESQPSDIVKLHADLFKKHGISTIRNFDALNDVDNLIYSGQCIIDAGLKHQVCVTLMELPPGCTGAHDSAFYIDTLRQILDAGIPYDSEAALALADRLGREIAAAADATSAALGEEKGVFPNWEQSIYADGPRYRNATRTCIAPTGTIAIIAGASPGIEPLFSLAHQRRMGDGTLLTEASVAFEQAARDGGFHSQTLLDDLALGGSIEDHDQVPAEVRRRFATAHEIAPQWHARMQAAFQARTDLAVSKTVNLPHAATPDQISEVFQLTHELGCKGVTVYRDGSRAAQVLSHPSSEPTSGGSDAGPYTEPHRRHLPDERRAVTHKFRVGDQEGYLTVGLYDDGTPGELFMKMAKEGSTVSGLMDAVALLTSISLQYGVTLEKLADKLEQTRFEPYGSTGNPRVPLATSILDYVFRWLRLHFSDEVATTIAGGETVEGADDDPARPRSGLTCPDCGLMLDYAEGCLVCRTCGYTRCG